MNKCIRLLNNKPEYAQYMLGIEHIFISSSEECENDKIRLEFKAPSTFHRMLIHCISDMYSLQHFSHIPDKYDYHYWRNEDVDSSVNGGYDHGPACEDCNELYICYGKKVITVSGKIKYPTKSLAELWKALHPTQKTNDTIYEWCLCADYKLNFNKFDGFKLSSHEHFTWGTHGKIIPLHIKN